MKRYFRLILISTLLIASSAPGADFSDCTAQCETLEGIQPLLVAVFFSPSDGFSLQRRNEIAYNARNAALVTLREQHVPIRDDLVGATPHLLIWIQFSGAAFTVETFVVEDVKLLRTKDPVPVHTWETRIVGLMPRRTNQAIVNTVVQQVLLFAHDYRIGNHK